VPRQAHTGARGAFAAAGLALLALAGCNREPQPLPGRVDLDTRVADRSAVADAAAAPGERSFVFGFDLRASPQEDARQYLPFLRYLERRTGYRFRLHFAAGDARIVEDLGRGAVDFAALGAYSFVLARERYGAVALARGLDRRGRGEYRSLIVVAPGSPLKRVADLRGRRLAFGATTSTQGHLIPRIELMQHGVALADLASHRYTGSHRACAGEVIAGRADACGMQDVMAEELADQGLVRILHASAYYPSSGIAASARLPAEVRERVRRALVEFEPQGHDAAGLYRWDKTEMARGFVAARDGDYASIRDWLRRLGMLETAP
jgi:phosphonate transport system substrate-binding protein